jgi:hypothetical protein
MLRVDVWCRYVRFGHLSVAVSLRGFFRIKLDSVPLEVKDWTARSELLSWQQLLHRCVPRLVAKPRLCPVTVLHPPLVCRAVVGACR